MATQHPSAFAHTLQHGQQRKPAAELALFSPERPTPCEIALAFCRAPDETPASSALAGEALDLLRRSQRIEATQSTASTVLVECYRCGQAKVQGIVRIQLDEQRVSALTLYSPR